MTRKERNKLSQTRIIDAAMREFGEKRYARALAGLASRPPALQNTLLSSEHMQDVAAVGSANCEALNLHLMDILLHGVIEQT